MDHGRAESRFRTTSWTLILAARASASDLEELLRRYWSPVSSFLRRSGWRQAEAEDLTQDFVSEILLGRDLIGQADPERGRFRSFLLAALRRFSIDARRRDRSRAVHERPLLPDDAEERAGAESHDTHDPITAFNRQWAAAVFDMALRRTEEECREDGMARQWRAFEGRVQQPIVHGGAPVAVEALLEELKARDSQEIYDMVQTVKRKLRHALRDVVAETVDDPSEVDQELAEVRRYLSK